MAVQSAKTKKGKPASEGATSRKRSNTYHHGNLQEELVRVGREIVEEVGSYEMSLREAARRANVSPAAPKHHFGDKNGLLAAIAEQGFNELKTCRLDALDGVTDEEDRVRRIIESYVAFAKQNPRLFRLMFGDEIRRKDHPSLISVAGESFNVFSDATIQYCEEVGVPEAERSLVVMTAWSIEHGIAELMLGEQIPLALMPVNIDELIASATETFLVGVKTKAL